MNPDYKSTLPQSGQRQKTRPPIESKAENLSLPSDEVKKPKNHKKLVIALVVLALIIAGGLYFWSKTEKAEAPTSMPAISEDEIASPSVCEDEEVEYVNEEIGVRFCYPEAWGDVSIQPGEEETMGHLTSGSEKVLRFSLNDSVVAGLKSNDWTHNDAHHGGINQPGVKSLAEAATNRENINPEQIYVDDTQNFAYVELCAELCSVDTPYALLSFTIALSENETYQAIQFHQRGDNLPEEYLVGGFYDPSVREIDTLTLLGLLEKSGQRFIAIQRIATQI